MTEKRLRIRDDHVIMRICLNQDNLTRHKPYGYEGISHPGVSLVDQTLIGWNHDEDSD